MKPRIIAGTLADATLPRTAVTIRGKEYYLCFDLGALAEAETAINAELTRQGLGNRINLLVALPAFDLASTRIVFAAAVRTFHPDLSFEDARRLPRLEDLYTVGAKLREAWEQSRVEPAAEGAEENPQPAAAVA